MEHLILPDDKQDAFDVVDIVKDKSMSELLKYAMLWYARGQEDNSIIANNLQPTS